MSSSETQNVVELPAGINYPGLEMDGYHHHNHNETTQKLSGIVEQDNQPVAPIRHVTPIFTRKVMVLSPPNENNKSIINNNNNPSPTDLTEEVNVAAATTTSAAAVDYGYGDAAPDVAAAVILWVW